MNFSFLICEMIIIKLSGELKYIEQFLDYNTRIRTIRVIISHSYHMPWYTTCWEH